MFNLVVQERIMVDSLAGYEHDGVAIDSILSTSSRAPPMTLEQAFARFWSDPPARPCPPEHCVLMRRYAEDKAGRSPIIISADGHELKDFALVGIAASSLQSWLIDYPNPLALWDPHTRVAFMSDRCEIMVHPWNDQVKLKVLQVAVPVALGLRSRANPSLFERQVTAVQHLLWIKILRCCAMRQLSDCEFQRFEDQLTSRWVDVCRFPRALVECLRQEFLDEPFGEDVDGMRSEEQRAKLVAGQVKVLACLQTWPVDQAAVPEYLIAREPRGDATPSAALEALVLAALRSWLLNNYTITPAERVCDVFCDCMARGMIGRGTFVDIYLFVFQRDIESGGGAGSRGRLITDRQMLAVHRDDLSLIFPKLRAGGVGGSLTTVYERDETSRSQSSIGSRDHTVLTWLQQHARSTSETVLPPGAVNRDN